MFNSLDKRFHGEAAGAKVVDDDLRVAVAVRCPLEKVTRSA